MKLSKEIEVVISYTIIYNIIIKANVYWGVIEIFYLT